MTQDLSVAVVAMPKVAAETALLIPLAEWTLTVKDKDNREVEIEAVVDVVILPEIIAQEMLDSHLVVTLIAAVVVAAVGVEVEDKADDLPRSPKKSWTWIWTIT